VTFHGNDVRDVIIGHMRSAFTNTLTDAEKCKQSYVGPEGCMFCGRLAGNKWWNVET